MTVSSETYRVDYTGNGVTLEFAITFKFLADAHIRAVLYNSVTEVETELELTTHYTLTGAGVAEGGTLTMLTEPTADETLTIIRSVPLTQETDYVEHTAFPADSHEEALDKLTMQVQQLQEQLDRVVIQSPSQTGDLTLPSPVEGFFLRWVSDALENVDINLLNAIAISAYGKTLVDTADVSAAQTILGISEFVKTILDDATAAAVLATLGIPSLTAFAKTILDDADAATARATLAAAKSGANTDITSLAGLTTLLTLAQGGLGPLGAANKHLFVNAAGTAAEWGDGYKVGTLVKDISDATGTDAITGVGFKPSMVIFICSLASYGLSIGVSNAAFHVAGVVFGTTPLYTNVPTGSIWITDGTNHQLGSVSAFGADGFTIYWVKTATPVGSANVHWIAFR